MKTHRILGILWLAFCGYFGITILWGLRPIFTVPNLTATPDLYFAVFMCLVYLAGTLASIFLFRGARWARVVVGIIALVSIIACIGLFVAFKSVHFWVLVVGVFALVSAILLLLPRRHVAT